MWSEELKTAITSNNLTKTSELVIRDDREPLTAEHVLSAIHTLEKQCDARILRVLLDYGRANIPKQHHAKIISNAKNAYAGCKQNFDSIDEELQFFLNNSVEESDIDQDAGYYYRKYKALKYLTKLRS